MECSPKGKTSGSEPTCEAAKGAIWIWGACAARVLGLESRRALFPAKKLEVTKIPHPERSLKGPVRKESTEFQALMKSISE